MHDNGGRQVVPPVVVSRRQLVMARRAGDANTTTGAAPHRATGGGRPILPPEAPSVSVPRGRSPGIHLVVHLRANAASDLVVDLLAAAGGIAVAQLFALEGGFDRILDDFLYFLQRARPRGKFTGAKVIEDL